MKNKICYVHCNNDTLYFVFSVKALKFPRLFSISINEIETVYDDLVSLTDFTFLFMPQSFTRKYSSFEALFSAECLAKNMKCLGK